MSYGIFQMWMPVLRGVFSELTVEMVACSPIHRISYIWSLNFPARFTSPHSVPAAYLRRQSHKYALFIYYVHQNSEFRKSYVSAFTACIQNGKISHAQPKEPCRATIDLKKSYALQYVRKMINRWTTPFLMAYRPYYYIFVRQKLPIYGYLFI